MTVAAMDPAVSAMDYQRTLSGSSLGDFNLRVPQSVPEFIIGRFGILGLPHVFGRMKKMVPESDKTKHPALSMSRVSSRYCETCASETMVIALIVGTQMAFCMKPFSNLDQATSNFMKTCLHRSMVRSAWQLGRVRRYFDVALPHKCCDILT